VRQQGDRNVAEVESLAPRLRELWASFWAAAERFTDAQRKGGSDEPLQVLLTLPLRRQRSWSELAHAWENLDVALGQLINRLAQLQRFLEGAKLPALGDTDTLMMEAADIQDNLNRLREQLGIIIGTGDEQSIHWMARDPSKGNITLNAAPLEVSTTLAELLFSRKECVVLTSATLSTQGTFDYVRQRLGFPEDTTELLVGSPFDYQKAALLIIPEDMPPPNADDYIGAISRVLIDLGKHLEGHTMALFTSYAALRSVSQQIRASLIGEGIEVLAQGVDGSPQQLIRRFTENPQSVLLGTSSFWEGVDLTGGVLKALVLTRLPFQVPTDPIVKARSDQYQDSFNEYSVPQAVLRFRQGMGRLIRSKADKGAIIVLDKRITGRSYGHAFLKSIPPCTLKPSSLATVGTLAADWVKEKRGTGR
jgi:Rad3-related DNA helicase